MRIEDYALIGDLQTAALVGRDGSIDWCCFPRFDSGACFAALLGTPDHGRWLLAPHEEIRRSTRRYRHDTLILESVFETESGAVRAIEFMPPRGDEPDIVRIVEGLDGEVPMRSELVIRFDYGSIVPWVRRIDHARVAVAGPDALCFRTPVEVRGENMTTVSEFVVRPGERVPFVLTWFPSHRPLPDEIDPEQALDDAEDYWHELGEHVPPLRRLPRRDPPVAARPEGAHPSGRPGASSPRRPPRSRNGSAASATGTTASAGCATPPSRSWPCSTRATATRRSTGGTGCSVPSRAARRTCRSCTASPASGGSTSASSSGWRATRARGRCGSETRPRSSSSSTSTAR